MPFPFYRWKPGDESRGNKPNDGKKKIHFSTHLFLYPFYEERNREKKFSRANKIHKYLEYFQKMIKYSQKLEIQTLI